jgi:hypothetical protein
MSFVMHLYQMIRYHARRLRTYPLGVIFGTGLIVLLFFFTALWALSILLTLLGGVPRDHRLAVIVPFRDRFEELLQFVPYMTAFLAARQIKHRIFIVNQADEFRYSQHSAVSWSQYQVINQPIN